MELDYIRILAITSINFTSGRYRRQNKEFLELELMIDRGRRSCTGSSGGICELGEWWILLT
jgi:hypothetical protein